MSAERSSVPLVATDLDRTLIYSRAAIEEYGGGGDTVAVERYQDADASFMTATAATHFSGLHRAASIVPTTTRTPEQLARIALPGPPAQFAIAANGGVLLVDGRPDPAWESVVAKRLATVAGPAEVLDHVESVCRAEWTKSVRTACAMFCYAVLDRDRVPTGLLEEEKHWADARGWQVSLQGSKLYWVPRPLTKSAAVAEVREREASTSVIAAGDSLLDADLLLGADVAIAARHGELVAGGWRAAHVDVTDAVGIRAGEEIVSWFAARLASDQGR